MIKHLSKWQSNIEPPYPNPFLVDDPLNYQRLAQLHRDLDTGWYKWINEEDGKPDSHRQKQAIANALRIAALSSDDRRLKDLAMHYQHIMHIPYNISDPKVYHDALEQNRINHNRQTGHPNPERAHKPHFQAIQDFYRYYQTMHPHLSPSEVKERADRQINKLQYEIEQKLKRENPGKPYQEDKVIKALEKRLKQFIKGRKTSAYPIQPLEDPYPGYSQSSLVGLSNGSRYIDPIYQYATEDAENGGEGYHFRDGVLGEQIPGLGPKEASLAWYLLAPNSSQLAIVDDPTLEALGYNPDLYNIRDYGLLERMLQGGRDASGYEFLPLSQFQKGLLDAYHGPSDLSSIRVWNPTPYHQVEYPYQTGYHQWPEWFSQTQPYRDQILEDWNQNIAPYYPAHQTPIFSHKISSVKSGENKIYFEVPEEIRNRIYRWASFHFERPIENQNLPKYTSSIEDSFNHAGTKLIARSIESRLSGPLSGYLYLTFKVAHSGKVVRFPFAISSRDDLDDIIIPPLIFRTNSLFEGNPWHLSTIGPNVDNSNPDPMANIPSQTMPNPEPMPSHDWMMHEHPCPWCNNSGYVELNGKRTVCPHCSEWDRDSNQTDTFLINDPVNENPAPGPLNEELTHHGP